MNKKRERERDVTLVSEQHTKNRLKVNIAGLSTVQRTAVCRNSVSRVPPLDEGRDRGQFHSAGV